jgi:H+/Cl- antiporter ClcA
MTSRPADGRIESLVRSRSYVVLLVVSAVLGVPISALAYGFLQLTSSMQKWVYTDLPHGVGLSSTPQWWPLIPLAVAGLAVGAIVRYLPGGGGEVPLDGFKAGGVPAGAALPGMAIAAIVSISLGAVVGPEAPLIALGGGLAAWSVRLAKRDLPAQALAVIAATGSFAAISTLLGSPLVGAFLLLEVTGVAGAAATAVLVPGLLAAGIGALIFTGLGSLTGEGTFSLAIPDLPTAPRPTVAAFGWALLVGVLAALACWLLRRTAGLIRVPVNRWTVVTTTAVGLAIAGLAIGYHAATGQSASDVLFSGQSRLPSLLEQSATYSVGALLLLLVCKGVAYAGSLVAFRGGPTFPAMFIGATGGLALSHLPGLDPITGAAVGIGAMTAGMLRLPFTAVLITSLFLGSDGVTVMPLVIVAVVVAHVITVRLTPVPDRADAATSDQVATPGPGRAGEVAAAAHDAAPDRAPVVEVGPQDEAATGATTRRDPATDGTTDHSGQSP